MGVGVSSFRAVGFCFGYFERPKVFGVCLALVVSLFSPKVWFRPFKRSKPLGFCLALIVPLFSPKVFWFGPFERSKPLGFCLAFIVPLVPKVFFGSDLLTGRSPLAFILALIVPLFSPKVFWFGPFERSKSLGVYFDKYAKFADSTYFANL